MIDSQTQTIINILNDPRYATLFFILMIWALVWKGVALWKSAHHNQRNWFIVLLMVNSFGILEILYLAYFQKNKAKKIEPERKSD